MYWHFYGPPCVVALEKGIDWLFVSDSFQCWSVDFFCGFAVFHVGLSIFAAKKQHFQAKQAQFLAFEMVSDDQKKSITIVLQHGRCV